MPSGNKPAINQARITKPYKRSGAIPKRQKYISAYPDNWYAGKMYNLLGLVELRVAQEPENVQLLKEYQRLLKEYTIVQADLIKNGYKARYAKRVDKGGVVEVRLAAEQTGVSDKKSASVDTGVSAFNPFTKHR